MAIGTIAAIALGAGALGSAAISSGAAGKASKAATDAANTSAAVQREQLQVAQNALSPYNQAGVPATQAINALLGLPAPQQQTPQASEQNLSYDNPYMGPTGYAGQPIYVPPGANPPNAMSLAPQTAQGAFDNYRKSTGYNFRFNEGMRALNAGYAGNGTLQSGDAMKSALKYGQDIGSGEFNNYLAALGNQQSLGLSAGSALAGVGQNYANSLTQINANKADAIGNAAMMKAAGINNMLGGLTAGIFKYGMK